MKRRIDMYRRTNTASLVGTFTGNEATRQGNWRRYYRDPHNPLQLRETNNA